MSSSTPFSQRKSARPPSRRDQDIFRRVVVHCQKQSDIAQELKLSPGRLSQIITRVRRWLACGSMQSRKRKAESGSHTSAFSSPLSAFELDETFDSLERQRLERTLARERHEAIYSLVMREAARQAQHARHTTTRTESQPPGDESSDASSEIQNPKSKIQNLKSAITKIVTTVRDAPVNVQLFKVAQRSAIELQKLAELQPLPSPEEAHEADRLSLVKQLLVELLGDAVRDNKVRSTGWADESILVDDLLDFLLGEPHRGLATSIIAADAEHGRYRGQKCGYPGRDPMRIDASTQARSASEGPGSECDTPSSDSSPSVPGSSLGPRQPEAPASPAAANDAEALNKTKPTPAGANNPATDGPLSPFTTTPAAAETSASPSSTPDPRPPIPVPKKNSTNFSAKPGKVIYLGCHPDDFDRMFHPWKREF